MANDRNRVANWTIGVGLDSDADISQALSSLKSKFQAAVNDLQRISGQANLFEGLQDSVQSAGNALAKAKQDVVTFTSALAAAKDAGKDVTSDLEKKLISAQTAVRGATSEFNKQVDAISRVENQLTKAGVDTANMTAAQIKLATATSEATEALTVQSAKGLLGLKTLGDVKPTIDALTAALNTLKNSGKLSIEELAAAQGLLKTKLEETNASVSTLGGSIKSDLAEAQGIFSNIQAKVLGAFVAITTLTAGIRSIVDAAVDFRQGLGQIGTITAATSAQLDQLGGHARDLAKTLGIDVNDALKNLYEIIRSTNLGPNDALTVLADSGRAAKASLTDLNVVTKVSADLISAYGLKVADLRGTLDVLFKSASTGGPTFTDLSGGIGKLSVVANAAGIGVKDLSALLNVMTNASGDGAGAVTELQRIITQFNAEPVRQQLRGLGIVTTDFIEVLKQLSERHIGIDQLVDLGVASSKAAVGINALTRDSTTLKNALDGTADAADSVANALTKVEELPKDKIEKLIAAIHDLKITLAEKSESSAFVVLLTDITNRANEAAKAIDDARVRQLELKAVFGLTVVDAALLAQSLLGNKTSLDALAASTQSAKEGLALFNAEAEAANKDALRELADNAAAAVEKLRQSLAQARTELGGIGAELLSDVKALNDAAAQQIAIIGKVADEQIAALDRSAAAATKTAQQTVDIQTKTDAAILQIITDNAKEVARVTDEAILAKEAALRKTSKSEQEIYAELAKIRIAALQPTIVEYQKFYDTLIAQSQAYAAKLESLERGRLAFNQSIEQKIFDLRLGAVDAQGKLLINAYDQQIATANRAEQLISLSRAAADKGDLELAQKYADQAIAISGKLQAVEETEGRAAISQQVVQTTQLRILKEAQDAVGVAFDNQAKAAKNGLTSTNEALVTVKGKLDEILKVQQDLQKIAKEGLEYKIRIDENSYDAAKGKLDQLTADRTLTVRVKMEGDPGFTNYVPVESRAAGGYVRKAIQGFATGGPAFADVLRYAGGGSVFRPPTWNKVPGVGNEDTVPALLNAGSFVMKKAASQFYGDNTMGRLVRGYASGGTVDLNALRQSLQDAQDTLVLLKRHADLVLNPLIDGARTLPRSQFGENYADALQIIRDLISASTSASDVSALLNPIEQSATGIAAAIDAAHKNHVPLVFGVSATGEQGGVFGQSVPSGLYGQLVAKMRTQRYAGGGTVDTVRALLTPGEHVLKPPAVQFAARMFGGGFLDAINNMRVPKGFLDGIMNVAPPRRFAEGGYVDGPGAPMPMASLSGTSKVGSLTVNVYPQSMSESELNRTVLPWFNKTVRNSR